MNGYTKRSIGLAGVALAATALAGCGSSSKAATASTTPSAGASTAAASSAATPTGTPIKIGVVGTFTGPASGGDSGQKVFEAWVSSVNAAGGIGGHPIQATIKDDAANPSTSTAIVQGFISAGDVAIFDGTNDDVAWEKTVDAAKIPVIGISTAPAPFYTDANFYASGQTEDSLFNGVVGAAKKENATNLGLMYCAEAVECQEGIAPLKAVAGAASLKLGYTGSISATAPNYTAQCLAAKQAGVDALFIADVTAVDAKVGANCTAQSFSPPIVVDGTQLAPALTTTTGLEKDSIYVTPDIPYFSSDPAATTMMASIKKYQPNIESESGFGQGSVQSWVAGKLFEAAATAGNLGSTPTAAALTTGLDSLKAETLGGLVAPLTFTAGKPSPDRCWYLATIKNGTLGTPYGTAPQCAS